MSFLAPLFLLGSLAVGLPVVFHLIRRTTRERTRFSSLMFLLPSPPRLTQRSRLEHILLLVLRCVVICLLALGFARPFLKQAVPPPAASKAKRILLLVDSSASMRRAGLWSDARYKADSIVRKASAADQVALFTFDRQVRPLFTFDQWTAAPVSERPALLSRKLADASPGWGSTHLGSALIQAAELLAEPAGKAPADSGRIELITDLQEGSQLEQLQGYEWPKGVEISVNILKPRNAGNASIQLLADSEESSIKPEAGVRVRITNTPGSKREQFKVGWARAEKAEFAEKPIDLYVPAGQSRVLALPIPAAQRLDRIRLMGDEEEFDNLVFAVPPQALRLNVLYLGTDTDNEPKLPLYFLRRAFQETRHQAVSVTAHRPDELLSPAEVDASCLFVVTSPLTPATLATVREQVAAGKTILVAAGTGDMRPTLAGLLRLGDMVLQEVQPANYAMLGQLDFQHPIFAPFADPRFSDFTKIHFWRYLRLDASAIPHSRVLASFDSGDPALVEVPTGSGRVLVLTSGWHPQASQLALSSKFVPLLYAILETSGVPEPLPEQYRIGDVVPLTSRASKSQSHMTVQLPDASELALAPSETNFSTTTIPGVYTVTTESGVGRFVVNLDPSESRTAPLALDELERLGLPLSRVRTEMQGREAERKMRLQNAELENRQKLWRWFIAVTLAVLLLETWLAGRAARQVLQPANMPAS